MADLNALIAQGAQFNLPNPVDQYSKVMQLQSAQQQMQMNRQQAQQIEEDRAGFAKLREKLADKNLTLEDAELALLGSPSKELQKMGLEMKFKRIRLADLDKEMGVGVKPAAMPAEVPAPMDVPSAAAAPVAPKREMFVTKDSSGRSRYLVDGNEVSPQDYQSMQAGVVTGAAPAARLNAFELPAFEPTNALAAQVAPAAAAPVANAMLAQPAVANAMAAKQAQIAEINRKLDVLNSPRYSDLPGAKGRIDTLERQLKQLTESPVGKPDTKDFTVKSLAAYAASGDLNDLVPKTDERLAFDKTKFEWEKANPGKEIKEVTQNGVTNYFAFDKRSGVATPVTVAGGKILTGTDMASQRLAFDRAKFAWEKSNPGFTIQQAEDGSIVGVNNRTLQAYPVNLNAGPPPSTAPFTGGGVSGGAPSVSGAGRGSVSVTDGQMPPVAPVSVPLKGKAAGLNESQGNATAFGMRMKQAHDLLTGLEKSGATDTGLVRGAIGGTLGLTPLIGDKLDDATGNIFNALPAVLGGLNEQQQQTVNARINFITALLRKESGAAIGPNEFSTAEKLYFPKPGDSASVIAQKQNARNLAIQAMKIQAGPGAKSIESLGVGTESESDPLGIRR
jgi:hypothetical protein